MTNMKMKLSIFLFFICTFSGSTLAQVAYRSNITDHEYGLLPKYCPYTQSLKYHVSISDPSFKRWEAIMGIAFHHMHHYCWAHVALLRSERASTSAKMKQEYRLYALNDFRYVVQNSPADFVLLPEIYTWIGRTEILLRQPNNARDAFLKAQSLKPDYWPAYSHWAEYLRSNNKKEEALEVVKTGLQHAPKAKVLLNIYRTLGGKTEDIPLPIIKQEHAPAEPNVASEAVPENPSTPSSPDESVKN